MRFNLFVLTGLCLLPLLAIPRGAVAQQPIRSTPQSAAQQTGRQHTDPLKRRIVSPRPKTDDADSKQSDSRKSQSGSTLVRSALALAFVLCLILVGAAWLRKYFPQANRNLPSEAVQLLGQRSLGGRQLIQLIRCGSRILIVGSTPQGLTTLSEVTDPVEVDYLAGLCRKEQANSVTSAFAQLFQNYREASDESKPAVSPLRALGERLGWSRSEETSASGAPSRPIDKTSATASPEDSLKARLGRLGPSQEPAQIAGEQTHG